MKYQRNNIIFRIASADVIAKFKRDQAASFLQLVRKELNFDTAAREAVLLEFDRFSQWIFRTERICCGAGEGTITSQLYTAIVESLLDEFVIIETIMDKHSDVFTVESCEYTKMIHAYSSDKISSKLVNITNERIDVAFCDTVNTISEYLQHVLIVFHEYNVNIAQAAKEPFISICNFTANEIDDFAPEVERVKYFTTHSCGSSYTFKNYTDANLYGKAHDYFSSLGILMIPEEEHAHSDFAPLG